MKKIITILLALLSLQAFSQSTTLVISQVYGGGGNSGAPYNADFVELHNVSTVAQSTAGLSVQYASSGATGTWTGVFALPTASIPAGSYFLIRMSTIGTNGVALPTPDAAPSSGNEIAMSSTNGRVALVNGVTALSGCPTTNVIDLVGFGTSVCFETAATPALSNTTAAIRNNNGCTDTDNNGADFTVGTPSPRNSASTANICGSSTPTLSATALADFGNVCVDTTAGPNSFTITGTSLTTADVTVGALTGFTYSTTSAGTYTTTLSLTQPGGAFTQEIFVKFTPTAVQSYNGNIAVGGGGATSIAVAAAGSGVNSSPTVTSGSASGITATSATVAGTIPSTGCSALSAYGIEYSTTSGFPNGSGTAVASTNLSGINFSSNLTGLTNATIYYYHAYATNGAGTSYGAEQNFTTGTTPPPTSGIVISQVFGGGGNSSATYNQDFVELFNSTTATIDISGWSVQYASATGPSGGGNWAVATIPASTTIGAGKYYLIALATGATGGALPTPDLTNTGINMSGSAGKIALVNNAVALVGTTACSSATVVDVLGYGTTATCSETSPFSTTGIDNTKGIFRKMNGCTETNNNSNDFELLAVSPRNSASTANICGVSSTLSATALASFGNVCINTTAGPNSFTITGTSLTTENVFVAALLGFTYSTTSAGPYSTSLSLTQPGGAFTQNIYVKFAPISRQAYSGNIVVGGGGANTINVAAAGTGINITVSTGAASNITNSSATLAGSATTSCLAINSYGIEYSLVNNFPPGTGTQVLSSNISGGNFTAAVSGLSQGLTYYYRAFASNDSGYNYGLQQSFTTTGTIPVLSATPLTAFGATCINTQLGPNTFTIISADIAAANIVVGPLNGYSFSTTSSGTYSASLSLAHAAGPYTQNIYVLFNPTLVQSYDGNIPVSGGGATPINVAASGSGVNTNGSVATGAATLINPTSTIIDGSFGSVGCSGFTTYGVEYSSISGLANGLGTKIYSSNLSGNSYSVTLNGLVQGGTYYYKSFAANNVGIAYGVEKSFTLNSIPNGFVIYSIPVKGGEIMHYSYKGIKPGHYEVQLFNAIGQLVFQRSIITQVNFIDDNFTLPGNIAPGVYSLHIVSPDFRDKKVFMIR